MNIKNFSDIKYLVDKIDTSEFKKELFFSLLDKYKVGKIYYNAWNNTAIIKIKTENDFIKRFAKDIIEVDYIAYTGEGMTCKMRKEQELWTLLDRNKLGKRLSIKYVDVNKER